MNQKKPLRTELQTKTLALQTTGNHYKPKLWHYKPLQTKTLAQETITYQKKTLRTKTENRYKPKRHGRTMLQTKKNHYEPIVAFF